MHEATEARRKSKRSHRARSKRKQGARVETTRNATMTQRQTTITEYVVRKYREDKGSGQILTQQKHDGVLRCFAQNPNGVCNHNDNVTTEQALRNLKDLKVDVIALTETNQNWHNKYRRERWEKLVKRCGLALE